jgi:hypothetical protein
MNVKSHFVELKWMKAKALAFAIDYLECMPIEVAMSNVNGPHMRIAQFFGDGDLFLDVKLWFVQILNQSGEDEIEVKIEIHGSIEHYLFHYLTVPNLAL